MPEVQISGLNVWDVETHSIQIKFPSLSFCGNDRTFRYNCLSRKKFIVNMKRWTWENVFHKFKVFLENNSYESVLLNKFDISIFFQFVRKKGRILCLC